MRTEEHKPLTRVGIRDIKDIKLRPLRETGITQSTQSIIFFFVDFAAFA